MNSIQVFFLFYIFVLVKSFHPSQHDIRRNIKAWGGYFFRLVVVVVGPVEMFQSSRKKTDRPNGLVASSALSDSSALMRRPYRF
jgi:hypothetical protein